MKRCGQKRINKKYKRTEYCNEEVKAAAREKKLARKKYLQTITQIGNKLYRQKNQAKETAKRTKQENWE